MGPVSISNRRLDDINEIFQNERFHQNDC